MSAYPKAKLFNVSYFDPRDLQVKKAGPASLQACILAAEEMITAGVPWVAVSDATIEEIGRQELAEQQARAEAHRVRFWQ